MTGTGKTKIETFDWNPENIQKLTDLWNDERSLSAYNISKHFNGVTRNAIIGKAHRLGLPKRKKPNPPRITSILKAKKDRRTPFVKPLLVSIPPVAAPADLKPPTGPLIPFMKINYRTCRSVEGHEMVGGHRLAMYCPNPKEPEEAFCPYHQRIYYRQDVRR